MRPIWLCVVVVTGCGFKSTPGLGNQAPVDATDAPGNGSDAGSGSDASMPPPSCLASWINGTVKLETPLPLLNQHSPDDNEGDPWLSPDGLTLYYTFQAKGDDADLYRAIRATTSDPFPLGSRIPASTSSDDGRPSLSGDGKILVFASDSARKNTFSIYYATRPTTAVEFPTANTDHLTLVNMIGASRFDPFLTKDGLELYFAPFFGPQKIYVAARASTDSEFLTPVPEPTINNPAGGDADPALSPDRRVIVFSSARDTGDGPKGINLWYAARTSTSLPFGAPKLIPGVNTDALDGDPMLSDDGCTLYLSSTRDGSFDLFSAAVEIQ